LDVIEGHRYESHVERIEKGNIQFKEVILVEARSNICVVNQPKNQT
jgi:hypothetical protein